MFKNIAILTDADNASHRSFAEIYSKIEQLGNISCRKIYGDWGQSNLNNWQPIILRYALEPMQQFAYVKGKNATDIALVIEAMDLLYSEKYDCFCLVSSDSDFASLAVRVRNSNVKVFGFGEQKTVQSFRDACDEFFEVEKLINDSQNNGANKQYTTSELRKDKKFRQAIDEVVLKDSEEWIKIGDVARHINNNHKDIDINKYGYKNFTKLILAFRIYQFKKDKEVMLIRHKPPLKKEISKEGNKNIAEYANNKQEMKNESANDKKLLSGSISLKFWAGNTTDCVLWRLSNNKVRGDEDMIFYGQTATNGVNLYIENIDDKMFYQCDIILDKQPSDINKICITLSDENSINNEKIYVKILENKQVHYHKQFVIDKECNSFSLLELIRQENGWMINEKYKPSTLDLLQLCHKFGVEVE